MDRADENKTIIRRLYDEAVNRHDARAVASFYAEDADNHGVLVGRDGIERLFEALFAVFPDWRYSIEEIVAEGDRVMCRTTLRGTHLGAAAALPPVFRGVFNGVGPTGRSIEVAHFHLYRIVEGKIAEHAAVRDDLVMLKQLDLLDFDLV